MSQYIPRPTMRLYMAVFSDGELNIRGHRPEATMFSLRVNIGNTIP